MRFLLLIAAVVFAGSACGRSGLGARCTTDGDCRNGFFCAADGFCADEDDNGTNNNVTPNNCVGDDCPTNINNVNGEDCYSNDEGICVFDICPDEDAGELNDCTAMVCDLGCPPDRVQVGCECVEVSCETDDDCDNGLLCLDGICDACKDDAQCPTDEVCSMGSCVEEAECSMDTDCSPSQRCVVGICRDRSACVFDADCPVGQLCFSGVCTLAPDCQVDMDCPQGQECVGGNCFVALCRGPEDCEAGELCDAGECVIPPTVGSCLVATQDQLISDGQRVPLEAFAFDQNGAAIAATFVWTSSDPDVARVVPGPNAQGGASAGVATLSATTPDGVTCMGEASLTNPGPILMNMVRVVVTDMESGAPISDALVNIGNDTQVTDAAGVANLPDPGMAYAVSVFHDNYNWLTVRDVSATDIRLPVLRRSGTGPVAGFTGEFDTSMLHSSGNITLGLAGSSIAGGLLELGLGQLLGDTFVSRLEIPGVVDEEIPLPGGIVAYGGAFGFMANIKETYYAQSAGGPRLAWGLAGLLPFAELLDFFMGGGGFDGNAIIAQLLPLFNRFDHAAFPSVFNELPRITDTADIDRDLDTTEVLPDYAAFPVIDLVPSVRQNLVTDVAISNFPVLSDGVSGLAILVGGVVLPSPGFVPTGISATADEDGDGRPDLRRLSIAPSYGPLVGGRYAIVAITFGGGGGPGGPGGFQLPDEFSVALWSGQNYPTALSLGTFPDGSQAFVTDATRSVSVSATAGPLFRVRMQGDDRSWDVWSLGPPGFMGQFGNQIDVPLPPAGGEDLFTTGRISVDAIQTNVNVDDLVSASGFGLKNAGLVTSAYNRTLVR